MHRILPLLLLLLAAWPPAPAAADRTMVIEDFDVHVVVERDGSIRVTETLRVRFDGAWNGVLRNLSLRHERADGRRERLRVRDVAATGPAGNEMEHWLEGSGDARSIRIRVPGAEDATRIVVIRYVVENAVRYFRTPGDEDPDAHFDELYWNATGNDWEVPILASRVRVTLPAGVAPTQVAAYTGPDGATEREADTAIEGTSALAVARRGFSPGEGLTIGVAWPAGEVAFVEAAAPIEPHLAATLSAFLLPLLAFLFGLSQWKKHGRDPARRPVTVQYAPPAGLTPTELGTLVDHRIQMHDITAALVDLAVRGYVHVEEKQESRLLGLVKSTEYTFHIRPSADGYAELKAHERLFLETLRQYGRPEEQPAWVVAPVPAGRAALGAHEDEEAGWRAGWRQGWIAVKFSDLSEKFYKALPGLHNAVYDQLVDAGHYDRRPDHVKGFWIGAGIAVLVASFAGVFLLPELPRWLPDASSLFVAGVLSGIVLVAFGRVMPARTEKGARTTEAALGFKEFLSKVETPRYRLMITSPDLFERYLPHAMAFQVESRWAKAFEGMFTEPPQWYHGSNGGAFAPTSFASSMRVMSAAAGSALASSPSSSGSGGGGSSGGGSGGGGGGGW